MAAFVSGTEKADLIPLETDGATEGAVTIRWPHGTADFMMEELRLVRGQPVMVAVVTHMDARRLTSTIVPMTHPLANRVDDRGTERLLDTFDWFAHQRPAVVILKIIPRYDLYYRPIDYVMLLPENVANILFDLCYVKSESFTYGAEPDHGGNEYAGVIHVPPSRQQLGYLSANGPFNDRPWLIPQLFAYSANGENRRDGLKGTGATRFAFPIPVPEPLIVPNQVEALEIIRKMLMRMIEPERRRGHPFYSAIPQGVDVGATSDEVTIKTEREGPWYVSNALME